uniref:Serpentine Receptor, class H n=1 Tax=Caenorhabditis tropicalis TaxID=1561998 RepID=A0A1I7TVZ6_9PELO
MIFESEKSLQTSLHIITAIGTPLHIFGTYCILFKTPKSMGSVKWILLNLHIWSMILDYGFTVLVNPLLILPAIAGYCLGLLRYWFDVPTIYQICLILSLLFTVCVSIVFIFENRYYQLFAKNSLWRYNRIPFISINYICTFTYLVPACLTIPDQKHALKYTFNHIPNLVPEVRAGPIFVLATEYQFILIPYGLMTFTVFTESVVFIGLIYWNMESMARKSIQSGKTVKLQKKFLNAIYAQATVFLINLLAPQMYILFSIFSNFYNQGANNLVIIVSSLHGINSTLIMIWAHKPYREVCYNLFGKSSIQKTSVVSIQMQEDTRLRNFVKMLN